AVLRPDGIGRADDVDGDVADRALAGAARRADEQAVLIGVVTAAPDREVRGPPDRAAEEDQQLEQQRLAAGLARFLQGEHGLAERADEGRVGHRRGELAHVWSSRVWASTAHAAIRSISSGSSFAGSPSSRSAIASAAAIAATGNPLRAM